MGLADDTAALEALGELLAVEIWLRPAIPDPGPAGGAIGSWVHQDGRPPVGSVAGRFASPPERLRVRVTGLPLGVISTKPTPTPGTTSAFSARPFEMPSFPANQSAHKLFRLTVGSGADSGFASGYITFSVDKSWMDENDIHPWSVFLQPAQRRVRLLGVRFRAVRRRGRKHDTVPPARAGLLDVGDHRQVRGAPAGVQSRRPDSYELPRRPACRPSSPYRSPT